MSRLADVYRAVHRQAFMPIFVDDPFDSRMLVEACVAAGMQVIEYTQRRRDFREMIPWIRKQFPDLYILVGSTVDDDGIVRQMRRRHPQLMTIAELAGLDVQGFVSMLSWSEANIRRYAASHLVVPSASTVEEAYRQTGWGAHFQKVYGARLDLVQRLRSAPTFDFCPIFVTGETHLQRLPEIYRAGAVAVGHGIPAVLMGQPPDVPRETVTAQLKLYLQTAQRLRAEHYPELAALDDGPWDQWCAALPHMHPFSAGTRPLESPPHPSPRR